MTVDSKSLVQRSILMLHGLEHTAHIMRKVGRASKDEV